LSDKIHPEISGFWVHPKQRLLLREDLRKIQFSALSLHVTDEIGNGAI